MNRATAALLVMGLAALFWGILALGLIRRGEGTDWAVAAIPAGPCIGVIVILLLIWRGVIR